MGKSYAEFDVCCDDCMSELGMESGPSPWDVVDANGVVEERRRVKVPLVDRASLRALS